MAGEIATESPEHGRNRCRSVLNTPRLTSDWVYASRYRLEIRLRVSRSLARGVTNGEDEHLRTTWCLPWQAPGKAERRDGIAGGVATAPCPGIWPPRAVARLRQLGGSPPPPNPLREQKTKKGLVKRPRSHQNRAARPPPAPRSWNVIVPCRASLPSCPSCGGCPAVSAPDQRGSFFAWQVAASGRGRMKRGNAEARGNAVTQ